jgi:hypothetical protein
MIPIEIDRLEYMMKYVIKNDFIKRANYSHTKYVYMEQEPAPINELAVIIDGQKYKVI